MSNFYRMAAYHWRKSHHQCVDCGDKLNRKQTDIVRCTQCEQTHLAGNEATRQERRERGLCVDCAEPAKPGSINCQSCLDGNAERVAKRRVVNRSLGVCPEDGNIPLPDRIYCGEHGRAA